MYIPIKEYAQRAGVTRTRVYQMIEEGKLKTKKIKIKEQMFVDDKNLRLKWMTKV